MFFQCLTWLESHKGEYQSRQIVNVDAGVGERDARQKALSVVFLLLKHDFTAVRQSDELADFSETSLQREADYTFFIDSYAYLLDTVALRRTVEKAQAYEL